MVLEIAGEVLDRSIDARVLVNFAIAAPAAAPAIEEPQHTIRIGVAMPQIRAEIFGRARKPIAGATVEAVVALALDLGAERSRDALVGVQTQHPVVLGKSDGECFLRSIAIERAHAHIRAM